MPLDPLVTTADLEARLGRSLTAAELLRVDALISDASASVRGYIGQDITAGTSTDRLKVRSRFVLLPQRPVTAVSTVVDTDANAVTFEWDGNDRVTVSAQVFDSWAFEPYRFGLQYVDVTYDHGYALVPDDIIGVVSGIVLRSFTQSPDEAGIVSETIDEYTYRLGSAAAAGGFGFLQDERNVLDRYRRVGGSMRLAW